MPRTRLRKKKSEPQSTVRPNHKLPPELITEIFEHLRGGILFLDESVCEPEIPNAIDDHFSSERSDLFMVSMVCRVWRQIAISRIWQKVKFQLDVERDWEKLFQLLMDGGYGRYVRQIHIEYDYDPKHNETAISLAEKLEGIVTFSETVPSMHTIVVRFTSATSDHIAEDLPPVMDSFFSAIAQSCRSVRFVKIHTSGLRGPNKDKNKDDNLYLPSVSDVISMVTDTVREIDLMMHVANQETIGALRDCKRVERALVHCCSWGDSPGDFYILLKSWKYLKKLQIEPPHNVDPNWEKTYTKSLQYLSENCGEQLEELWMPLREKDQKLFCDLIRHTPNLKVLALEGREFENDGHFLDVVARTTPNLNYMHLSFFPAVSGADVRNVHWDQLLDVNIMCCEVLENKSKFFDRVKDEYCPHLNIHIYDQDGNVVQVR
ncbi:2730_t:CDS:1 [Acaulospora morrowiae]|uniref:2730_t:CDS:1 n=1 Tax=Acaulospora morrowiae TaxID=94023 RepID=A0A9N8YX67_9GLOM|nr:2730_t:CDS:1 [Acaulospora morrowiae]